MYETNQFVSDRKTAYFNSGETSDKKNRKFFVAPKALSLNFIGSLSSYFWATTFISVVIGSFGPFGTLVPSSSATVKYVN